MMEKLMSVEPLDLYLVWELFYHIIWLHLLVSHPCKYIVQVHMKLTSE